MDHFPTEEECDKIINKDNDIKFYIDNMEISYNNLREYTI